MKFVLLVCLLSVAKAGVSLRRVNMRCNFKSGDRVMTTGTIETVNNKRSMALVCRSATTMLFRIEVFGGLQLIILRSKRVGEYPPRMITQTTFTPQANTTIQVTVNNQRGFVVTVDGRMIGTIPRIRGPAPTFVETAHGFNTASLQVISQCAINPQTNATITPTVTPAVTPTVTPAVTPPVTPAVTPPVTPTTNATAPNPTADALLKITAAQNAAANATAAAANATAAAAPLEAKAMADAQAAGAATFMAANPAAPQAALAATVANQSATTVAEALQVATLSANIAEAISRLATEAAASLPSSAL